jgi:Ser/Thr protein kinase RdoA (MazF antagonist)
MDIFPVSNSTLDEAAIAQFAKDRYALAGEVQARLLKTGINHTYLLISTAGKSIFRVYSFGWRTEKEIDAEITLVNRLHGSNVPVSYAIADANGQFIQRLQAPEGMRYAVLFSYAKGEKQLNFSAALHQKAGTIMAHMHQCTEGLVLERVQYITALLLDKPFEELLKFLPAHAAEMKYMRELKDTLHAILDKAAVSALRQGMVHLDIWFDNMVIDNEDITIFDFDFCGRGWLLLDIAYYTLQLFSTEKDPAELEAKQAAFFKGYESVLPVGNAEKKLLPAAACSLYFFYLGVQCSRFSNWSNVFVNDIYLKRFINLLVKKMADFHGIFPLQA